ncbi:MAG: T9SS type A sorting domain-containing protein [Bacteroidota bacterium]
MKKPFISFILFLSVISSFSQPYTLTCNVYGSPDVFPEFLGTNFYINGDMQDYSGCGTIPAIHVAIIDTVNCLSWETCYEDSVGNFIDTNSIYGHQNECGVCRMRPERYFSFLLDWSEADQVFYLDTLLRNPIITGKYLLIYSWQYIDRDYIMATEPDVYSALTDLGATNALLQADSVPIIFFTKAGFPATSVELIGNGPEDSLQLTAFICNSTVSSFSQKEMESFIEIFPNPADDHFTIRSSSEMERVEVYDMPGKKVVSVNPMCNTYSFPAINFPPGMYHVSITGKNKFTTTKKIIVTR